MNGVGLLKTIFCSNSQGIAVLNRISFYITIFLIVGRATFHGLVMGSSSFCNVMTVLYNTQITLQMCDSDANMIYVGYSEK